MKRKIVKIDREKCNGCGACVKACHEGAIALVEGKAMLTRDDYCDGLGDCLPACPTGAISFEEREAAAYDEAAVAANKAQKGGGCPGVAVMAIKRNTEAMTGSVAPELTNWPVQIKLVPTRAPYFNGAELLVAADCAAYAYAAFHSRFIKGRITLIGCPKLDGIDYSEKLGDIIANNDIKSVTVVRMQVPCCGGLSFAVERAVKESGKNVPCEIAVVTADGRLI